MIMDKTKASIQLNLLKKSSKDQQKAIGQSKIDLQEPIEITDSSSNDEVIFLDKNETFTIPLDKKSKDFRFDFSFGDKEKKDEKSSDNFESIKTSLDKEFLKDLQEINSDKSTNQIDYLNQLNQSNYQTSTIDNLEQSKNDSSFFKLSDLINDDSSDSCMSISSNETSGMSIISKNFPEFFHNEPTPSQIDQNLEQSKEPEIDFSEQIPFLERKNNETSETTTAHQSFDQLNFDSNNNQENSKMKSNSYEFDKDDEISDIDIETTSINESIDNLEPSIFDTLPASTLLMYHTTSQIFNDNDFLSFLKHVDPGQFTQEEDKRLYRELSSNNLEPEDDVQVTNEHYKPFEINKTTLNNVLNKISLDNNVHIKIVSNIIQHHLKGSSQAYISRYEQHFEFMFNPSLVNKIIKDFDYLVNVNKLKTIKKLVLSKKNRFDQFGCSLIDRAVSYENIAIVFHLYYENTSSDVCIDDELSLDILSKKESVDLTSYQNKSQNNLDESNSTKLLYESTIKTISHFLSKDEHLIEFLNTSKQRPTFTVRLNDNQSLTIVEKYKRWEYQNALSIEDQTPVDMLSLIYAEEMNQLKIEFDFTKIEKEAFQLLVNYFPFADIDLLKDCFNFMWSFYFKDQLCCYFRYEIKIRSKKLLNDDFELILKSILLREPAYDRTILCVEPQGFLFKEGFQFGIRKNNANIENDFFKLTSTSSFNDFLVSLYHTYRFTNIIFANSYFSYKLCNLISDCLKSDLASVKNQIAITVLQKDNTLIDKVSAADKVNFYLDRFSDPLRHWISFKEHMTITNCDYFELIKPRFDEILTEQLYRCVSFLAVDVNTEDSMLRYVNGLNDQLAKNIIEYRRENNSFFNRLQLKRVPGITDEIFKQCAGFLVINQKTISNFNRMDEDLINIYDSTIIHPDIYDDATSILTEFGLTKNDLAKTEIKLFYRERLRTFGIVQFVNYFKDKLGIDPKTTKIVLSALTMPLNFDYRTNLNF